MNNQIITLSAGQLAQWTVADLVAAGRAAIERAGSFADVKDIADRAAALHIYQRSIGAARDAQNAAAEIRIRAERRMGEELSKAELAKGAVEPGTARGTTRSVSTTASPTLAEIGISKDQSSRFQHLAAIPEDTFEAVVEAHKIANEPVSAASVARTADALGDLPKAARDELVAKGEAEIIREANRIKRENKARAQAAREERRESVVASLPARTDRFKIIQCSVANIPIEDESVDCIITDPPYPAEFLPVYADLAATAARVLKPGGSCFVMIGQSYLPDIIATLAERLTYQWTIAYLTPGGQATQVWPRKVNTFWKPVLWFVKDAYSGEWLGDVAQSKPNDNDKRFHHWGQSESGMADLMRRFSEPGHVVLDPFVGGGTTGAVALDLGRRFVGCDIDAGCVARTIARLNEGVANAA